MADSWRMPQSQAVVSPNAGYVLRIDLDPESVGSVVRYHARLIWLRWQSDVQRYKVLREIPLSPRLLAPVRSFISDRGEVILLDRWFGNSDLAEPVVWVYAPNGTLVQQWRLEQIYSPAVVPTLPTTTSTIHWLTSEPWIREDALIVPEARGGEFAFDFHSGAVIYQAKADSSAIGLNGQSRLPWLLAIGILLLLAFYAVKARRASRR